MKKYILVIDQSTSSSKAILFDREANLICRYNADHTQYYLQNGWVEHDAVEIYQKVMEAVAGVYAESGISPSEVCAVGISNQRETSLVWNRKTGVPVCNAIVWQCPRAKDICDELSRQGHAEFVRKRSGMVLSPYFPAAKIKWILDNVAGARDSANRGDLVFGTIDTWLVWCMTGGKTFATDYSNASRTQLFNIAEKRWDDELFELFTIPRSMAAEVVDSGHIYGYAKADSVFGELPIASCLGDSHAALFGQNCFSRGMAKATYGTGSSIMMNIGKEISESNNGLVTSIAWGIGGEVEYVFEGNLNCTGDTIKWLSDNMGLISNAKQSEGIAARLQDNGGVYLVPAFVGLGAPYWNSNAQAVIAGMTRQTTWEYIVRAGLESIAYQIKDLLDLMIKESGISFNELRVDGGPTKNKFLMQFQADMIRTSVACTVLEEISALGAAYMAGLTVGFWNDKDALVKLRRVQQSFSPQMSEEKAELLYAGWRKTVERSLL